MKDGLYRFRFLAADTETWGTLRIERQAFVGDDPQHQLRGDFSGSGQSLLASFDVTCGDDVHPPIGAARSYTLKLFGSGTDQSFDLIGVGPLGLIVEIAGHWESPLSADAVRMPAPRGGPSPLSHRS